MTFNAKKSLRWINESKCFTVKRLCVIHLELQYDLLEPLSMEADMCTFRRAENSNNNK